MKEYPDYEREKTKQQYCAAELHSSKCIYWLTFRTHCEGTFQSQGK